VQKASERAARKIREAVREIKTSRDTTADDGTP